MGRKARKRITYDSDDYYGTDSEESVVDEEPRLWTSIMHERDDTIYELTRDYECGDYIFKYICTADVENIVDKLYYDPDLLYRTYKPIGTSFGQLEDYAYNIFKIYNLDEQPYLWGNEEDTYMPLCKYEINAFIQYTVYELKQITNKYFGVVRYL